MGNPLSINPATLPSAWADVTADPRFATSARRLAANMLDLCDRDERLAAVFKDAGRYVAAMSAVYLHQTGLLTVTHLKQVCGGTGMLSPGRAQAMLEFLLHIDYVGKGSQSGTFHATDRFLDAWCGHLQAALQAAAELDPTLATVPQQLDDRLAFGAFLKIQADRLYALAERVDPYPALHRAFLHPHAGSQILWALTVAGERDRLIGDGEIKLSLSELAHRFNVTHLHVRRLFRRAQQEGILIYHGHGRLRFEPAGLDLIRCHYALQLNELIACGRQMLVRQTVPDLPAKNVRLP